jgi:hypothetical protein
MPQLNVQVNGAPGPQIVTLSAIEQDKPSAPFVIFPDARQTNPEGFTNFINLKSGDKLPPLLVAVTCQQYTTPANEPVLFDSSADLTIQIPYLPFKSAVPVLARPPLPLPLPDPTRDADVWATVLPWDQPAALMATQQTVSPRLRRNLRRPQLHAVEPAQQTTWTSAPEDRDYLRGDAWGVVMPGAPMIDGASAETPDQILSWFIDRYPLDFQKQYLTKYAGYGYTHLYLSPPDSIQGYGFTLDQFVETCRLVRSYGLYVGVMLSSKYFQKQDMTVDEYTAYVDPLLDALLDEADEFVPAWEMNLYNTPGATNVAICRHVGQRAHAAGKSAWLHFSPHVTSWFADGDPRGRFGYWDDLEGDVDGINYQTNPEWTTQEMCDRMVDTLWQFGEDGNRYKFRLWEDKATQQYNGHATPDDGDARGYLGCCTYDNVKWTSAKVWGFGNGGRRPDGTRI